MFRIGYTICLVLILILPAAPARVIAAPVVIKIATVTPEGTTWTRILHRFAGAVEKQTAGEIDFKIYAGGISGDELDVLRKMRVNRIHAAGLSGVGLGVLLPEIRILEAPLLFRDYGELDHVKSRLFHRFAEEFQKKGYVLLGFVEAGFVYFYAKSDLSGTDALGSVKMWSWQGDPVAQTFQETFGIRTTPLPVTEVNTGLETGMFDAFYAPPLAAFHFQWYSRVQYMLDYPMVNSTGALIMTKRIFGQLSPENQAIVRALADEHCKELVRLTRLDNIEAVNVIKAAGIQLVSPSGSQISAFKENAGKTYEKSIPSLYSRELFDRVQAILKEYRAGNE